MRSNSGSVGVLLRQAKTALLLFLCISVFCCERSADVFYSVLLAWCEERVELLK